MLYNVFSFYGDVERIRIIRKDEQNLKALVQFTTASHACMARDYLDQVTIRGAQLAVSFSRHNGVRTAREVGREEDGGTKDFSGAGYSKYRRYATEDLKRSNMKKITKPTSTIHIGEVLVSIIVLPSFQLRIFICRQRSLQMMLRNCLKIRVSTYLTVLESGALRENKGRDKFPQEEPECFAMCNSTPLTMPSLASQTLATHLA